MIHARKAKVSYVGYLYILPSLILILVFYLIPIFMSGFYSFTKYNVIQPPQFVGLTNYLRMLKDPYISAALKNTVVYTFIVVPIQTVLSMGIAVLIAQKFRNFIGNTIKSTLFIPVISSMILCGTVWSFLMAPNESGILNAALSVFGIGPINWLGKSQTALLSVSIVSIWKLVGYYLVIFYAGVMDIPRTLYEAAEVDGANAWQQFRFITLPGLKPITFLVVTLGTIWSFQVFDLVYTMTNGGPGKSTVTLVYVIYMSAFREYSMGYASAIAMLLLALVLLISALQKLLFRDGSDRRVVRA